MVVAVSVLSVGAILLMGSAPIVPAVLEAQRFVLKDAAGHERGSLFATDSAWGLVLYNRDSSKAAAFSVTDTGSVVMLADHKGNPRDAMLVNDDENSLAMWDKKTNHIKIELKNAAEGSSLAFRDDNGTDRLGLVFSSSAGGGMTINDTNSTTRAAVTEKPPGLTLFDAEGAFVWMSGIDSLDKDEQKRVRDLIHQLEKTQKK